MATGLGEENDEVVVDVVDLYCKVRNLGKKEWGKNGNMTFAAHPLQSAP